MELFEVRNGHVIPSAHALRLEPFKSMWESDTSEDHENCLRDFDYIEFVCSPKKSNPFHGYSEDIRPSKVKERIYGDVNYPLTDTVILACIEYKEHLSHSSPSYPMYDASVVAAEKLRQWLLTFNLSERTPNGAMVLKPKDVSDALAKIPENMQSMEVMRDKVHQELLQDLKTRNNREVGRYER